MHPAKWLQPRLGDGSIFKRGIQRAFNLGVEVTLSESQRCGSCFCGCRRALSAVFFPASMSADHSASQSVSQPEN